MTADRALLLALQDCVSLLEGLIGTEADCEGQIELQVTEAKVILAARAQPEARAIIIQCPACGEEFVRPGDESKLLPMPPCPHGFPPGECAACDGGSSPEMPLTLGCEHGRLPGHPCPHCMGINAPPLPPAPLTPARTEWQGNVRALVPPAPPVERFWRVVEEPTSLAGSMPVFHAYECDADGMMGRVERKRLSATDRPARAEAEADGVASGLRPWKGGGK